MFMCMCTILDVRNYVFMCACVRACVGCAAISNLNCARALAYSAYSLRFLLQKDL